MNIDQLRNIALHDDGLDIVKTSVDGSLEWVQMAYQLKVIDLDEVADEYWGMEFNGHSFDTFNLDDSEGMLISDPEHVQGCIIDWLWDAGCGEDLRGKDGMTYTREWRDVYYDVAKMMCDELPWRDVVVVDG